MLKKDVQSNVKSRKAVYISVLVVKCYVDHLGNKAAAKRCADKARKANTSQWDINGGSLAPCVSVASLKNSFGPLDWKPSRKNCRFWKKVFADIAVVAEAAAAEVEPVETYIMPVAPADTEV